MRIEVLSAEQLTPELIGRWSELQGADVAFDSPFFRPEFTQAVAAVRDDVEVAVVEIDGQIAGFFPFHRGKRNVGWPVGWPLSDFHGPVLRRGVDWDAQRLLRGCKLSAWHFNHLPASLSPFQPYHWFTVPSPYIDTSAGLETLSAKNKRFSEVLKGSLRRLRKVQREVGPLRYELDTKDGCVLDWLIASKIEQYRRIGAVNYLGPRWSRELLRVIVAMDGTGFGAMLSALYIGDRLAAVHLGLRAGNVLHGWFPAYDRALRMYGPGLQLWLEMFGACPSLGIRRLDMGCGDEPFKESLRCGDIMLAEGSLDFRRTRRWLRRSWTSARRAVLLSSLRKPALAIVHRARIVLAGRQYAERDGKAKEI